MENVKNYFAHQRVDALGALLSLSCALHCLAMPLLVTILPLLGLGFLASERAELIIVGAAALALGSVVWGMKHHKSWGAFLILVVAVAFIATAHITSEGTFEVALHATGGVLLAAAHLLNRHLCKTCPVCERDGHSLRH